MAKQSPSIRVHRVGRAAGDGCASPERARARGPRAAAIVVVRSLAALVPVRAAIAASIVVLAAPSAAALASGRIAAAALSLQPGLLSVPQLPATGAPSRERVPSPAGARTPGGIPSPADSPARRIVSLAPNLTEMLFAIGAGAQVAGATDYCDFPPEARALPKVGGFVNPNPEAVLALAPDLVVATPNVGNRPFVERMMRAGARVVVVEARNLEEIFPAIETLGRASGHPEEAAALTARLRVEVEAIRREAAGRTRPSAILCIQRDPLILAGPGSYPHDLLLLAGARSIVSDAPSAYPAISLERVLEAAPEVILQTRMDAAEGGSDAELRRWWGRWESLPAVRSGRIHLIAGDAILRPGPRVAEGLRLLAGLLHPPSAAGGEPQRVEERD